jgi:DNA-binding transcriptional regulator YdaS (Cro superfamily)
MNAIPRNVEKPVQQTKIVSALVSLAVAKFGRQWRLADAAGVRQPTIHRAIRSGKCGIKLAQGIEAATGGEIRKSDLRPDIWPPEASA